MGDKSKPGKSKAKAKAKAGDLKLKIKGSPPAVASVLKGFAGKKLS